MKRLLAVMLLLSASALAQTTCINCPGSAYGATGGTVANKLPKATGTNGQLQDSSITDDGTTISTTEIFQASSGLVGGVAYGLGAANNGMYSAGGGSVDFSAAGTRSFQVSIGGVYANVYGGNMATGTSFLTPLNAGLWQSGAANAASPVAQTWQAQGSRAGTDTDVAGAAFTVGPGIGTGLGAGAQYNIRRNLMGVTGSAAQSTAHAITACESKTLSNTTATAQTLATIGLASNSAGGVEATVTVTCTDGTNFDSETQSFNASYVNKATVITVGGPVITTTSAANNSGSCTAGITVVGASPTISLKVTPAFTTIVPTIVTGYITIRNNGVGAVACQ